MLNLPANFETYAEARKSGFMKMKEIKDNGGRIVGVYCSFVPQELLMAAGAAAAPLCASSDEPIPAAETKLPRNLCPLIKASYGFALTECIHTHKRNNRHCFQFLKCFKRKEDF